MRKYNSLKPSGVEWIGEIPEHWKIVPMKYLVSTKITDGPHESPTFLDEGIPFLSVESVQDNKLDFDKKRGFISKEVHDLYSKKCKPQKDDVFIVKSGSTTGKSTIVETDIEFNIWSPLCIVRSDKTKILPRFTFSSIQSDYFRRSIELGWSFGTQPNIGMGVIENIKLVVPTLPEQLQIIDILDSNTEIIDKLISIKERKIEILKEQRISLINHVITKGLDQNVKMKDSGVEWIGKIPNHWKMKPLKYISQITLGKMLTPEDKGGYTLKPYLRSQNIQIDYVDISDIKEMWFSKNELEKYRLVKEDILVNEGGDVGRTCMWNSELDECYIQNSVNRVRISNGNTKYYLFHFFLHHTTGYFNSIVNRVSIPHLTKEKLEGVSFLIPPLTEQHQIVEHINEHTKEIDDLISMERKKVDLLKEYRQSLISEVITGKIDVRTNVN